MRGAQREDLTAQLPDSGLGAFIRDATLKAIGREDLVLDDGRDESGHRKTSKASPPWVYVSAHLTAEQHAVLVAAARKQARSLSALMLDSALFELGLEPPPASNRGWTRGKRRSSPPAKKR